MADDDNSPRYEIGRVLGRGGMGVVYEARVKGTLGFERKVAFKTLAFATNAPEVTAAERARMVRRFFDEARIVSRLHHGGIVAVLDYGIRDGDPFQVLELVDGSSVASLLRERAVLPHDIALHITLEVAHALSYAHRATDDGGRPLAIVHRDVKPSNILVSRAGDVKLVDFGIALANDRSIRTTTGVVTGTPTYMAPEQLTGLTVDERADVFALGCTLHAMLTGRSPLAGVTPAALFGPAELAIDAAVPDEIAEVIRRAVRKRPDDRFASANEMAKALSPLVVQRLQTDARSRLASWLRGRGETQEVGFGGAEGARTAPRPNRSRAIFVAAMLIVLGLGAVGIFGVTVAKRASKPAPTPPQSTAPPLLPLSAASPSPASEPSAVEDVDADAASFTASSSAATSDIHRIPAPVKDGCLCIPIKAPTTASLCHPALPIVTSCRCVGHTTMSWVECEEPHKPCERWKKMPSSAKDDDACTAYPVTFLDADEISITRNMRTPTKPKLERGVLECSRCLNGAVRSYPRKHGAPCRGIHDAAGQMMDGRIDCR